MVLKREGFQLISRHCGSALWIVGGLMALNKRMLCSSFHGFSHLSEAKEGRGVDKRFLVEMPMAIGASSKGSLCFRCCLDRHNGVYRKTNDEVGKAHAIAPLRHLIPDSNVIFGENVNPELLNGHGASRHGNPLGFPGHLRPAKMVVAVDVDEVLGSFLSALNKFIADRYASYHSLSEYYVYEFFKIWNCSRTEADIRVHEFFKTPYFKKGIHPIPGAQYTLQKLSTFCDLSVVTSRQNAIKDHTIEWIEKHYPGLFQEIHFGNHFALDGQSRQKSEICRSLGAQVLIDDNPRYAVECAEVGIKVLLFDYDNSYPWCKSDLAASHPLIAKVHNWQEVEQHLVSGVMSAD